MRSSWQARTNLELAFGVLRCRNVPPIYLYSAEQVTTLIQAPLITTPSPPTHIPADEKLPPFWEPTPTRSIQAETLRKTLNGRFWVLKAFSIFFQKHGFQFFENHFQKVSKTQPVCQGFGGPATVCLPRWSPVRSGLVTGPRPRVPPSFLADQFIIKAGVCAHIK